MEIIIQPTPEAATSVAARVIMRQLRDKPDSVLGLATGSTSLLLYRALIGLRLEWDQVTTFNLDEYVGLAPDHPHSYHSFMRENLFRHVEIDPENIHIPGGMARDVPKFCARYEKEIKKAGGIDLQVLGIGTDGHIGFNEPTSSLASRTRIKTLTQQTRRDYSRFLAAKARSRITSSRWASAPSWMRSKLFCLRLVSKRRKPSPKRWKAPLPRSARPPSCSCIPP